MKKTLFSKSLSFIACIVLIAAMALFTTGCKDTKNDAADKQDTSSAAAVSQTDAKTDAATDVKTLGEGQTSFSFKVVDEEGKETAFEIHTEQKTVGAALLELELIAGEESTYGLYVKTVNGVTVDYNTDGKYWAFYINGEYAMTGVDSTEITEGAEYTFKVEK
jgi:hypothetical protein